jgi:hypothetical protein
MIRSSLQVEMKNKEILSKIQKKCNASYNHHSIPDSFKVTTIKLDLCIINLPSIIYNCHTYKCLNIRLKRYDIWRIFLPRNTQERYIEHDVNSWKMYHTTITFGQVMLYTLLHHEVMLSPAFVCVSVSTITPTLYEKGLLEIVQYSKEKSFQFWLNLDENWTRK